MDVKRTQDWMMNMLVNNLLKLSKCLLFCGAVAFAMRFLDSILNFGLVFSYAVKQALSV